MVCLQCVGFHYPLLVSPVMKAGSPSHTVHCSYSMRMVLCALHWLPVPKGRYWYSYLIEVKTHCRLCRGTTPSSPPVAEALPWSGFRCFWVGESVPGALSHSQISQPLMMQHRWWHPVWNVLWGGCSWKYLGHPFHNANHSVPEPAFSNTPIPARFL